MASASSPVHPQPTSMDAQDAIPATHTPISPERTEVATRLFNYVVGLYNYRSQYELKAAAKFRAECRQHEQQDIAEYLTLIAPVDEEKIKEVLESMKYDDLIKDKLITSLQYYQFIESFVRNKNVNLLQRCTNIFERYQAAE